MEKKVKPEIMHLMILSKCDHACKLCCNKLYDIDKIPVATVEELKMVHTICITGGEPFFVKDLGLFARNIKMQYPNIKHLYVYTSGARTLFWAIPMTYIKFFSGINFAPKNEDDWKGLSAYAKCDELSKEISSIQGNRLYVFKDQAKVFEEKYKYLAERLNLNVIYRTWDKKFKTQDNEIFRRLPIFLG